ncbi:hypothetical protein [Streptomyces sp. bgisy100]|uniref:hypothetical protein n=1 Tax=Streptomyces sp. bgisy100 TaxID=3413783 RepID=UPI003D7470AC
MGNKPGLKVDYDLLQNSESSLKTIRREFTKCPKRQDELAQDVGAKSVQDVMHEFADNWADNREQILQSVEEVLSLVTQARKSFEKLDGKLGDKAKGKSS